MSWLSRLLRESPSLKRLANYIDRARPGERRRRIASLETLEDRTLLSNVTTCFASATSTLTITGDTHNDAFSITELSTGQISLVGTPAPSSNPHLPPLNTTQINGLPVGMLYTTTGAVLQLVVNLPGSNTNTDVISLTGHGTVQNVTITVPGGTATTAGTGLTLTVTGVKNSGTFTLNDGAGPNLGGALSATVTGSQFSTLSITQDGCSPAAVTLVSDSVAGAVSVSEGVANGDSITLNNGDKFGSTVLAQGAGPTMTGGNGKGDSIRVTTASVKDLTITQTDGAYVGISVNNVTVTLISFGVLAQQGKDATDVIAINAVTAPGRPLAPNNTPTIPDIIATQGCGNGDAAVVSNIGLPGNIQMTQGNGKGDYAAIFTSSAGYKALVGSAVEDFYGDASITQGNGCADMVDLDLGNTFNNVAIMQGDGGGDSTIVQSTQVTGGSINVSQGNGAGDYAAIFASSAGYTLALGPYVEDFYGDAGITQGNGYADMVQLDLGNTFNNVYITQGDSLASPGGPSGQGDEVDIDATTVTSDIEIFQGDSLALGNNVVTIGTTTQVLAGGWTYLVQNGANNTVVLGGAFDRSGIDFETAFLDINTGAGGGGYVSATNTTVVYGSDFGNNFVIDGGGDGNTFADGGGNDPDPLPYSNNYSG